MIAIDNVLISDEILQRHFVCNLEACKGACCVEGESGAPLEYEETLLLEKFYPEIKPHLTPEGIEAIEKSGFFTKDSRGKYKTPLVKGGICAYAVVQHGVARCGIQMAHEAGVVDFQKPVSCHLYPIRITKNRMGKECVNYEEWDICSPACELGSRLRVPLYKFLKDALIRKYGPGFYAALDEIASRMDDSGDLKTTNHAGGDTAG